MDAGSIVCGIAVSRDGKWIVSGTKDGLVIVWNAESHEKVTEIKRHTRWVGAVDVSPNGTKIASGSDDETACVWSLSTGQRLLGPLGHHGWVVGAKFSPDGCLIATATRYYHSVRVYDNQNGHLLVDVPIQVNSSFNRSLVWAIDGKQLFALSRDGNIHCLDPLHGTTLSKWPIHSSKDATCITLEGTGTLIAASAGSSVSFWGTTTRKQIGAVIEHNHRIWSIAISDTNDLAVCGNNSISLTPFSDILLQANPVLCFKTVQELRTDLINFQCRANQQHDNLCEIIRSMRADLHTEETSPSEFIITPSPHSAHHFIVIQANKDQTSPKTLNNIVSSSPTPNVQPIRRKIVSTNASVRFVPFFAHGMSTLVCSSHPDFVLH